MSEEKITWGWRRDVDGVTRHAGMDGYDDPTEAEHLARKYAAAPGYSLVYRFPGGPWMDDITNKPPQPGDGMVGLKDPGELVGPYAPTPCDLAAGDLIDRTCVCGHSGTVHHRDDQGGFVCDMCPIAAASDAPLREWLAEKFDRHDTGLASLGNRFDGLVDVVLRQENRLTEQINKAKGRDGLGLDGDWLEHQFEAIDRRFERILEQIDSQPSNADLLAAINVIHDGNLDRSEGVSDRAANLRAEYDRGVAAGRASVNSAMDADYAEVRARSFEAGAKIGASEREAELLEQGWTPPGAVHELEVSTGPTDYEVWRDALTASASNVFPINGTGEAGIFDDDRRAQIRDEAVWFYRELKAGPPPDLIDPADQAQETRAAANPADLIDGDVDHTQDPNDPTSAY